MSWMPGAEADLELKCPEAIEMVIIPRTGDLGNFEVRRALPFRKKRMVGPFIFWDQMGPGEFLTGQGIDVRPHPHIGLSTVTYLFQGSLHHRDSLGTNKEVAPGDINLMSAGRGIVHSERTGVEARTSPSSLFGIQSWVAQPKSEEDSEPTFLHTPKAALPTVEEDGIFLGVLLGETHGLKSPVATDWATLYLDVGLSSGKTFTVQPNYEERALYLLSGEFEIEGRPYTPEQMLVLKSGTSVDVKAVTEARFMVLGGATMDGPRFIWWNFVASSMERIEQAKHDWKARSFPVVPGDESEFIPLP